jgi:hypothetical protein
MDKRDPGFIYFWTWSIKELRGVFPESSTVGMNGYNAIGIMYAGTEVVDRRYTHEARNSIKVSNLIIITSGPLLHLADIF